MTLNGKGDNESGLDGPHVPRPAERVRRQVADYEASGGVEGATLEGRRVVILTSVGAKSGKVRKNPVMRIVDGDRYVAVASAGGSPTNPSWYANLVAHPTVRLQDGATVREFQAREVNGKRGGSIGRSPSDSGRTFPNTDGWQAAATSRSWCSSRLHRRSRHGRRRVELIGCRP